MEVKDYKTCKGFVDRITLGITRVLGEWTMLNINNSKPHRTIGSGFVLVLGGQGGRPADDRLGQTGRPSKITKAV